MPRRPTVTRPHFPLAESGVIVYSCPHDETSGKAPRGARLRVDTSRGRPCDSQAHPREPVHCKPQRFGQPRLQPKNFVTKRAKQEAIIPHRQFARSR